MIESQFLRSRSAFLIAPVLLGAAALLLAGCAAPGGSDLPDSPHKATLKLDGQSYTFAPTACETSEGNPIVTGPGVDHTLDVPVFLDMNIGRVDGFPDGKTFIYYDSVDGAPSDSYLVGEVGSGDDYSMGDMQDGFEFEVVIRNQDGAEAGTGMFLINCD